uniref:Tail protein n=1 Tax=Dulem virus 36 TaxID=3145754 RepID=A0AAU8B275_9CAUD
MIHEVELLNTKKDESITINRYGTTNYVIDTIDWGEIETERQTYRVPLQVGYSLQGVTVGTRNVTITGYVISDYAIPVITEWDKYYAKKLEQIEKAKDKMNRLVSILEECKIVAGEYYLSVLPTQPPKYSNEEKENNEVLCKFVLDFVSLYPLFVGGVNQVPLAATESWFHLPTYFLPERNVIFGLRTQKDSVVIDNDGDVPVGCIITLTALSNVMNPTVYNVDTGEELGFDGVKLNAGDYIVINTNTGEEDAYYHKVVDGVAEEGSLIGNMTTNSKFLQINKGSEAYAYRLANADKNSIDVKIEYTKKYFNLKNM